MISKIDHLKGRVELLEDKLEKLYKLLDIPIVDTTDTRVHNESVYSAFFYFDYMIKGKGDFGPSKIKSDKAIVKQRMDRLKEWFLDNKGTEVSVNSHLWQRVKNREIWLVEQDTKSLGYFQDIVDYVYGSGD